MKKYSEIKMEIFILEEDVITASNIVLPDDEIGEDVPGFEK